MGRFAIVARARSVGCGIVAWCAFSNFSCGAPALPSPRWIETRRDRVVDVGHPPPAALPEIVSEPPTDDSIWLDGRWVWRRKSWVWERGGWVVVPEDAVISRADVWYEPDGRLVFSDATWFWSGRRQEFPRILRPAGSPPTEELREESTTP